ncbi:Transposon Ty3-G Gag-Pol polyprotein [Thelohanellus kitauei]|uniref:Transposon Ty3-G Gag-Pol polyprotein n=1 Tax=Thelohanellus kitauei TaxID=669202 RepID=A0A0C2ISK5_THEKT|nr:Transposon Ty3-G Gag-Pol polyprotein [Thelohanellus kitauei]
MLFALKNAVQTFQRLIYRFSSNMDFVFVSLDDILVFCKSEKDHYKILRELVERLQENRLVINIEKCGFGFSTIEFLGCTVSQQSIVPLASSFRLFFAFLSQQPLKNSRNSTG